MYFCGAESLYQFFRPKRTLQGLKNRNTFEPALYGATEYSSCTELQINPPPEFNPKVF